MKVFVGSATILAFIALVSCNLSPEEENKVFNDYLVNHQKLPGFNNIIFLLQSQYKIKLNRRDNVDDLKRTFIKRYNEVENHNKAFKEGKVPYELGINEFSMLPYEQLIKQRLGYIPSDDTAGRKALEDDKDRRLRSPAPASFSWLHRNRVVRQVQNQGACGSCWAFAGGKTWGKLRSFDWCKKPKKAP